MVKDMIRCGFIKIPTMGIPIHMDSFLVITRGKRIQFSHGEVAYSTFEREVTFDSPLISLKEA